MSERLRWLIQEVAKNIVGLDLALFFQANPTVVDTAPAIGCRAGRRPDEVEEALDRLTAAGILKVTVLGAGRYRIYSLNATPQMWDLLCELSEAYIDDQNKRQEIIRLLLRPSISAKAVDTSDAGPDQSSDDGTAEGTDS